MKKKIWSFTSVDLIFDTFTVDLEHHQVLGTVDEEETRIMALNLLGNVIMHGLSIREAEEENVGFMTVAVDEKAGSTWNTQPPKAVGVTC